MSDKKNERVGDWGKMNGLGNNHVTQTNEKADAGPGAHVTTRLRGVGGMASHDYFDAEGNHTGSTFDPPEPK